MTKQKMIILGMGAVSLVVLLIILNNVFIKSSKSGTEFLTPTEVVEQPIPTVDSSVEVSLTPIIGGKEITLLISNSPNGTKSIDYELSYQTAQQGLQGVIGTIQIQGEKSYEKQLTLGTCSSGACVYHNVVGAIEVNLRFIGDYGEKIFEKEFEI